MKITLLGNPKSNQHIYKIASIGGRARMYMSKEGKQLKEYYQLQAKSQWIKEPLDTDVKLAVTYYFGDKRTRDIDNYGKLFFDSLTGIVWVDDKQVIDLHLKKDYDKDNPRIELEIL